MNRHYEYIDKDGKHCTAVQSVPIPPNANTTRAIEDANRLLAINARAFGYKPFPGEVTGGKDVYFHVYHPDFPRSERMKRINLIQNKNGQDVLYTDRQISEADKPGIDIVVAQFDKDGNAIPSMVIPPLGRTPIPNLIGATVSDLATKVIGIADQGMGTPAIPGAVAAPQAVAKASNEAAPADPNAVKPVPIEAR